MPLKMGTFFAKWLLKKGLGSVASATPPLQTKSEYPPPPSLTKSFLLEYLKPFEAQLTQLKYDKHMIMAYEIFHDVSREDLLHQAQSGVIAR